MENTNEDSQLLPHTNPEVQSTKRSAITGVWKIVAIAATLSVVSAFVISFVHMPADSSVRLQMAKTGKVKYSALSSKEQSDLFEEFKSTFKKEYDTKKEEKERFAYFLENLDEVDKRNEKEKKAGGSAVHGVTVFSDMSKKEFKEKFLSGYVAPSKDIKSSRKSKSVKKYDGTATNVDWSGVYTTGVNNQGYCGSCWAFSVAQQVESDSIRAGILTTSDYLAVQQLVSCDSSANSVPEMIRNYGCQGGNTETAYLYISSAGGISTETDYPYSSFYGTTGNCDTTKTNYKVTVDGYYSVDGEEDMKNYVLSTGPLSICLDASEWATYQSGTLSSCGNDIDHCVQVVGVNTDEGYWIVRNSWGTSWGQSGYIYLKTDQDTCGITTDPTYTAPYAAPSTTTTRKE